ncbi:hypothetical protein [Marmoricola sp. URHB0036]|uniref:hypothetical protein n=1 Tax=Marmoricola sp. URHB0036 TaxID=1298863 RepID=UPI000410AF6B|nr:hypothetical protein [Marmoricola sp. URHB0036]
MRRARRTVGPTPLAVLALVVLLTAGCEAPLAPDSKKADATATPSTSVAPTPTASASEPTPTAATPSASTVPTPSIEVPALPTPRDVGSLLGGDISWPQCPKGMGIPEKRSEGLPLPDSSARFVVIGLTNGPGFVANPCLASQVAWAKSHHLLVAAYSVISGPTRFSPSGVTGEELGRRQAQFNIASLKKAGLQTPIVWLDVESVPHFDWGSDKQANAAVVRGAAQGYTDAGYAVGVYSTPYLYESVVGDLALRVPEWRAAGQTSRAEALRRCRRDWVIQGGAGVLGQWVEDQRDRNVTCPGASVQLPRWFHQY